MSGIRSGAFLLLLLVEACGESAAPAKAPPPPNRMAQPAMDANRSPAPPPSREEPPSGGPAAQPQKKKEAADKKGRAKSPELFKKHLMLMEENGDLMEAIQADLDAKRDESAIKPKVVNLRKNGEAARQLHYRKDPAEDTALTNAFDLFLLEMKAFEQSVWTEETSHELLEKLGGRCRSCHDTFQ